MTLYECQGNSEGLEQLLNNKGQMCMETQSLPIACNSIVAAWTRGSYVRQYPSLIPTTLRVNLKFFIFISIGFCVSARSWLSFRFVLS